MRHNLLPVRIAGHPAARPARFARGRRVATGATLAIVVAVLIVAAAAWPTLVAASCTLALVAALALRAPAAALAVALGLAGFEGTLKLLLTGEQVPGPVEADALGAAVIDLSLGLAVAGVLFAHRRAAVQWVRDLGRWERVALGSLALWLALSLIQVVLAGDINTAASGFRLTQMYVAVGLGALLAAGTLRGREWLARALVWIGALVCGYAAVRVAVGPSAGERAFAVAKDTVTYYGGSFRAIGSFSGAVPMVSFLVPIGVFCAALGVLRRDVRLPALAVALLALVAVIGSYSRSALVALAIGLVCLGAMWFAARRPNRRQQLTAAALVAVVLAGTAGAALVAAQGSPQLRDRLDVFVDPAGDASLRDRLDTARDAVSAVDRDPFGEGLGQVGDASADRPVTTDNSYLKVLVEQGIPGLLLFLVGTVGTAAVVAGRLVARDSRSAVGIAALCGFAGFLALSMTGEYVEQPGKIVAWALLGLALACTRPPRPEQDPELPAGPEIDTRSRSARVALAVAGAAGLCAFVLALDRASGFTATATLAPVAAGPLPPGPQAVLLRVPADRSRAHEQGRRRRRVQRASGPAPDHRGHPPARRRSGPERPGRHSRPKRAPTWTRWWWDCARHRGARSAMPPARRCARPRCWSCPPCAPTPPAGGACEPWSDRPRPLLAAGAPAGGDAVSRPADRLVERLPGALAPRPDPGWSALALAGGLLALALAFRLLRPGTR